MASGRMVRQHAGSGADLRLRMVGGCLRPQDTSSLWDGAHDARLAGDVVDGIPGCKVDRADWSVAHDDLRDGVSPRPGHFHPIQNRDL